MSLNTAHIKKVSLAPLRPVYGVFSSVDAALSFTALHKIKKAKVFK
jgi:hypothetical protein